ncbi:MAG TPA: phage holin family protein [Candidatus Saccharimonadales bacterium]|nr:phage holin family protein [Candidatus Saccharimonadales bacterium]
MQAATPSTGMFQTLRKILDTGVGALHNRVELFAVEMKEEQHNLLSLIIWISICLFLAMMAIIVITGTVILMFEGERRLYAAAGFCALYLIGAIVAFFKFKSRFSQSSLPFSDTIDEMRKDREWLQSAK